MLPTTIAAWSVAMLLTTPGGASFTVTLPNERRRSAS